MAIDGNGQPTAELVSDLYEKKEAYIKQCYHNAVKEAESALGRPLNSVELSIANDLFRAGVASK